MNGKAERMDFNTLIDNTSSNDLQELHQLIYKKKTNDSLIKTNLKNFLGFQENQFEENYQFAIANFDTEELIGICQQLAITPAENAMEDAKQIVKKLTKTGCHKMDTDVAPIQDSIPIQTLPSMRSHQSIQEQSSSVTTIQEQSQKIHAMKKQLIDLEEIQIGYDENSEEFKKIGKQVLILTKRIRLEETRRVELLEERKLLQETSHTRPSSFHSPPEDQDIRAMLIKTPQNLKLSEFDGSSCLDFHYFMLQYNASTQKYRLTNDDNLLRLNDYIKGEARKKVDLLLKSSKDPSKIINILVTHYGGEDRVLKEIIKKSHGIQKVTSLTQFKEFNCHLQNISSVVSEMNESIFDFQRLLSIYLDKLPDHFTTQWANYLMSKNLTLKTTNLVQFTHWIDNMSQVVSEVAFYNTVKEMNYGNYGQETDCNQAKSKAAKEEKNIGSTSKSNLSKKMCQLCKQPEHPLYSCSSFKELDVTKRFTTAKRLNYCIFCLNKHFGFCRKRKICTIDNCSKYHHELLHQKDTKIEISACIQSKSIVLLKMLPVTLKINNKFVKVIAFLDDGSTLSLMDKSTANEIGLSGKMEPIHFQWTGDIYREDNTSENLSLEISDEKSNKFFKIDNVHTVDDLKLPKQRVNIKKLLEAFPELKNVNVSDSYEGCPVLLLGQCHADLITNKQTIAIPNGGPFVSKTKLGWAIHGPINVSGKDIPSFVGFMTNTEEDSLEQIVSNQLKLENIDLSSHKEEKEDEKIVKFMENSITKCDEYYEINLPWKESIDKLPDSLPMAKQRLMYLERTLLKDKVLLDSYKTQIDKLLDKKYARKIDFNDLKDKSRYWILPHFPVFNPKKPHKPARIVFDAAAKAQNNSLNDFLYSGPDLLCSIIGILLRFRRNKIAFTGDICEMFNRIKIKDDDTFAQCFLWRHADQRKPIELYQMKAMLFGLNCAPFIAQYVKNYNALQYKSNYPAAYKAITESHYVDDFVDSRDDLEESVTLINDVIQVHSFGGFQIRSFISNNFELIQRLPRHLVNEDMFSDVTTNNIQKVLGMFWDVKADQFHFLFQFQKTNPEILNGHKLPTKKEFLQILMTIYDPLGLLTPIVIKGKILFQSIWKTKITWNQVIPETLKKKLTTWLLEVSEFKDLQVPRCYKTNITNPESIQLHVFCDASIDSYCAVAYLRLQENINIEISLLYSKSRVTPISNKNLTIPKLELMGCLLGVRVANMIKEHINIASTHFWSDSMVALAWINSKKYLKVFEKNRVNEILKSSTVDQWNWIPSEVNIADLGTRDNHKNFSNNSTWFKGPEFLYNNIPSWKNHFETPKVDNENIGNVCMFISENIFIRRKLIVPDILRFSNFHHLLRVTSWVIRYFNTLKDKIHDVVVQNKSYISIHELSKAKQLWIKKVQQDCFKDDIDKHFNLSSGSKSRLSKYNYKFDEQNILRLQGRLRSNKYLSEDVINPIILDGDHGFTKLLVLDIHVRYQHFSIQSIIHEFKTTYWMPKMTSKIKHIIKKCLHCRLMSPQDVNPSIGNLIPERLRFFEKSFTAVGIDYFGPFHVKVGRKIFPRYGVLFTCLTTRATHVEIAHTLTSDSCLMAIRRMMARRGQIRLMISDNGSNFKGASSELIRNLKSLDPDEIGQRLVQHGIEWKFIPSKTPHFGGCWERMIGSFKKAASSVIPRNKNLNDEMLLTIFAETEYILNTRPYLLESDDPDDQISFSPMDVLIPKFIEVDPIQFRSSSLNHKRRQWRICEKVIDEFWNRFIKEYIPSILNRRLRRYSKDVQISTGDLVYIKNKIDRGKWPIGIVQRVFPGNDEVVRVADVKFKDTEEKMSVRNLLKINLK